MHIRQLFRHTFKAISADLGLPNEYKPMVQPTDASDFCRHTVSQGILTPEQMTHAALRYRLGSSLSGKPIYWMINELGQVCDGRLGHQWVSQLLKAREPHLLRDIRTVHCLFGLHLLETTSEPICLVESESSAVILSELYPHYLWLAWSYPANLLSTQFAPLQGRQVILFPPTDPIGDYFLSCLELADQVRRLYHLDITVDSTLDSHATPAQKSLSIDLLTFLLSSC